MSGEMIAIVAVGVALAGVILTATRGLRQDIRQDMAQLETRLDGRIGALESRLDERINGLESQISELRERMAHEIGELRERMAKLEGLLEGLREAISGRAAASMQGEPKQPKELRRPSVSARPRKNKGWFHRKGPGTGQGHFLACANQQGSCSMRIFDETSGAFLEKPDNKIGDYQERFAEDLKSAVELHISSQPNLVQASKNGLPPEVLSELQGQMS